MNIINIRKVALCTSIAVTLTLTSCYRGQEVPLAESALSLDPVTAMSAKLISDSIEPRAVQNALKMVADWQLAQYDVKTNMFYEDASADGHPQGWVYAALYVGLNSWAEVAPTKDYMEAMRHLGQVNEWKHAPRPYNADDYAIGQMYIDLYEEYQDPQMLAPTKDLLDMIEAYPRTNVSLEFTKLKGADGAYLKEIHGPWVYKVVPCQSRWCWADSLFMGPPVWAHMSTVTGDSKYLNYMDKEFWAATEYLFDETENLYFRDHNYFDKRGSDGKKIFWGRGNGWAFAGLARILNHIPQDHPTRSKYEELFQKMAQRLIELQTKSGYWGASLLSSKDYADPETSGTGFLTYGLAWGVNNGLLDRETTMPAIEKGWSALVKAVHPDGKLGWVQRVGNSPDNVKYDDTQLYGVGAYLMAGAEIYKLGVK
ncbi:glycoside hydrolase family 88/105 protein [Paremcibacter congregatus]|uniref:glycoside hydrolase family 88/105 protein n=1 Tax=Paremcibacter congregatus TaxID=2043170 RepID=UPI003A95D2BC